MWVLFIIIFVAPLNAESFSSVRPFLSLNGFQMTTDKQGGDVHIEIKGMMENIPFKIKGILGPLINALDPDLKLPVHITLETPGVNLAISGTIKDLNKIEGVDLDFVLIRQNLDSSEDIFGKKFPTLENFTFKGNIKDKQPLRYELSNLHLVMEKSELKGSCSIDFSKDCPQITADFISPYLDLRKVLVSNGTSSKNDTTHLTQDGKVFSNKPFDMKLLKSLNMKLNLSAEKMLLQRLSLNNFHVQANITEGGFAVDSLTCDIGGGSFAGTFKMEPSGETYLISTVLDIDQMAIHRMLEDMEIDIHGEGMLGVNLDLRTQGVSMAELMAGLGGNVSLVMGESRIDRNYLKFLGLFRINLISRLVNILSFPVGIGKKQETSLSNCFVMRLDINEGIAKVSAFILDTPETTVAGNGKIDFLNEKVDIYVKPISKEGIGAEGFAKFDLSLSELTKVFYLGGTLANPIVAVDSTQTFVTLGKAIGGVVLFGPAGVAAALLSGKIGGDSKNLCMEAIEVAQKGVEIGEERSELFNRIIHFLKKINPLN
jgi:AsmA family protein